MYWENKQLAKALGGSFANGSKCPFIGVNMNYGKHQFCNVPKFYYKHYYLILEIIILLGKHCVLQIFTTTSHMRFCLALPMPGIGFVQHNLCQEYVLSDITYAKNRFCST